jgi:hypothetical protein
MFRAAAPVLLLAVLHAGSYASPGSAAATRQDQEKERRPKLSLKANPAISFSPSRIYFTAELRGGADDYEEFYCPSVEWDWADGTQSETTQDCEPFEAGRSEIKRRYSAFHVFEYAGRYNVTLRLKRNNKVLVASNTSVQVRPGARDIFNDGL